MPRGTQLGVLGAPVGGIESGHTAGCGPHAPDPMARSVGNAVRPIDDGALRSSSYQKPAPRIGMAFGLKWQSTTWQCSSLQGWGKTLTK